MLSLFACALFLPHRRITQNTVTDTDIRLRTRKFRPFAAAASQSLLGLGDSAVT